MDKHQRWLSALSPKVWRQKQDNGNPPMVKPLKPNLKVI